MNEFYTCAIFCENKNCWKTWWEIIELKDMIEINCPRCKYKSKVVYMTKYEK